MSGTGLEQRLLRMTRRERLLLALLGLVGLPLGVVLGIILPLREAQEETARAAAEARELLVWVEAEARRRPVARRDPVAAAAVGLSGLERSLVTAGLRGAITELSNRGAGEVEIGFGPVAFGALADWLQTAERDGGYRVAALRVEAAGPGEVTAQITLAPRS